MAFRLLWTAETASGLPIPLDGGSFAPGGGWNDSVGPLGDRWGNVAAFPRQGGYRVFVVRELRRTDIRGTQLWIVEVDGDCLDTGCGSIWRRLRLHARVCEWNRDTMMRCAEDDKDTLFVTPNTNQVELDKRIQACIASTAGLTDDEAIMRIRDSTYSAMLLARELRVRCNRVHPKVVKLLEHAEQQLSQVGLRMCRPFCLAAVVWQRESPCACCEKLLSELCLSPCEAYRVWITKRPR